MNFKEFIDQTKQHFPVGTVVNNPGRGQTTIIAYDYRIKYKRGNSDITVTFRDLYDAYLNFRGMHITSTELAKFRPSVFSSQARPAGHSCNCTLLFMILEQLKLSGEIHGRGVKGNPFTVKIYPS